MNKYIPIIVCALAFAGCTKTSVTTPTWSLERTSIFQKTEIPALTISTNGTVALKGYSNDGGNEALGSLLKAMYDAGVASAKK